MPREILCVSALAEVVSSVPESHCVSHFFSNSSSLRAS
jgi:hypothetical protein